MLLIYCVFSYESNRDKRITNKENNTNFDNDGLSREYIRIYVILQDNKIGNVKKELEDLKSEFFLFS